MSKRELSNTSFSILDSAYSTLDTMCNDNVQ
jgi:hypothetical protein